MHYLKYGDVRRLHMELTNHCNAACPQCDRNVYGAGVNPRLTLTSLSRTEIEKMLPPDFCRGLLEIVFSGVHGDPMMAPEAFGILAYFKENGVRSLKIQTNGSMRDSQWWSELGRLLGPEDEITFGIDGLADTHEVYRRGARWDKATDHMRAFIAAGGRARWSFLIFRHNEHQVDEARALAREWGCQSFRVRMTGRFHAIGMRHGDVPFPVLRRSPGRPVDEAFTQEIYEKIGPRFSAGTDFPALLKDHGFEYLLEETKREEFRNEATSSDLDEMISSYGSLNDYLNRTRISCLTRKEAQLYIDASGKLWPCCYIGGDVKSWHYRHRFREDFEKKITPKYGEGFNDLRAHSLKELLDHPWFKDELAQSWENDLDDPVNPRLKRCGRTCGEKFRLNEKENRPMELSGS